MSRSYKHTPYCGSSDKFLKHYANKKVRKAPFEETLQHNRYKRVYESWNIRDYYDTETFESFCAYWRHSFENWGVYCGMYSQFYEKGTFPSKEDLYKIWYKAYKMK